MKTVLITGTSSGIGKATVDYFARRGWNVIATMRTISKAKEFHWPANVTVLPLDVTNPSSIKKARLQAEKKFGFVDVIINNAGYGLFSPIECASEKQIKEQFETNVFGVIHVIKEFLPSMRQRNKGVIINVSSILGSFPVPNMGYYSATKFAVEALTESLWYDLAKTNIRVKLVKPGAITTGFNTSKIIGEIQIPFYEKILLNLKKEEDWKGSSPQRIARDIYNATIDKSTKLRYPAGKMSTTLLLLRKLLPDRVFLFFMKKF